MKAQLSNTWLPSCLGRLGYFQLSKLCYVQQTILPNFSVQHFVVFYSVDIELLTNWGPIAFIVSMPIYMWILDQKGLRVACVSTALFVAIGAGIRCFPLHVNIIK